MIKTFFVFSFVIFALIILLPFGLIAMLLHFAGLKKPMVWFIYRLAQGWALFTIKISGAPLTVTGKENIPKKSGVCFVSNHCGYLDIMLLLAYCSRPIGFIAKKELAFIPFLNCWIFLIGGLFIDRSSRKKALQTINRGVERIKNGGGMIIFPEGHRSKGRGLLPFHPGSLKLATMAEAPIVPVAIEGSYNVFEKNKRVVSSPVKITFCEVIETANLPMEDRKIVLCDRIYTVINNKLNS